MTQSDQIIWFPVGTIHSLFPSDCFKGKNRHTAEYSEIHQIDSYHSSDAWRIWKFGHRAEIQWNTSKLTHTIHLMPGEFGNLDIYAETQWNASKLTLPTICVCKLDSIIGYTN